MFSISYLIHTTVLLLVIGIVARVVADFATRWSISRATKHGALAGVNERSSHDAPTPRLGGIGIAAGLLIVFGTLAAMLAKSQPLPSGLQMMATKVAWFGWKEFAGFFLATYAAFGLGLIDDVKGMGAGKKLAGQIIISIIPPLLGMRIEQIHFPGMASTAQLPMVVSFVLTSAWLLVMMNAVNFMDGINGLAGRFAEITAVGAFLGLVGFGGSETMVPLCAGLYGACDGFLKHNYPTAKTFMGDCGSQMIGMFIGLMGIHITQMPLNYPAPFLGFVIIVSLFIFDVLVTMIRRAIAKKNLMQAHREHFYQQHLIARGEDHDKTLYYVDGYLFMLAFLGAAYLHFGFGTHGTTAILGIPMTILQIILIVVALGMLASYARGARSGAVLNT